MSETTTGWCLGYSYRQTAAKTRDGEDTVVIDHDNGGQTIIRSLPFSRHILTASQNAHAIGTTTAQMRNAAPGAYFIYGPSSVRHQYRDWAAQLQRQDLVLVPWTWALEHQFLGRRIPQVVIDHHAYQIMPAKAMRELHYLAAWVSRP